MMPLSANGLAGYGRVCYKSDYILKITAKQAQKTG